MISLWTEIKRKLFHLTSLVYVAGMIFLNRKTVLMILIPLLVLEAVMETARLKSPAVNARLSRVFGSIVRESEERRFTGIFWMLLGVIVTAILIPPTSVAVAALLYVIIGDAVASLVGMRFGGPKWPGSKKTVSGSVACFLACLLIGVSLLRPEFGWLGIVIGAMVATVVEFGIIPLNDNFTIPAAASLTFMLVYGIRPLFF